MARPLPKTKAPALAKYTRICASSSGVATTARHAGTRRLSQAGGACATRAATPGHESNAPAPCKVDPLHPILRDRELGELVRGEHDDTDHRGAHAVEGR